MELATKVQLSFYLASWKQYLDSVLKNPWTLITMKHFQVF